ncbi:MAG: hypothetical protein L0241_15645 [Planctomycetia bacterium]|nr:hypothetical protein [Planctomycetia bacterium]
MGEVYLTLPPGVVSPAPRLFTPEPEAEQVASRGRGYGMDGIRELLEAARANGLVTGRFRGLLHIAIGRTVTKTDGSKLSSGLTWRELATLLKTLRFDPELGRELGADPDTLSPRDRERYWYAVIAMAKVDSPEALAEAEKLVAPLKDLGFVIAPPPSGIAPTQTPAPAKPKPSAKDKGEKPKSEKPEPKPKKKKK